MFDFPQTFKDAEWMTQGICSQPLVDPDWWFSSRESDMQEAARICQRCPVLRQCRNWALADDAQRTADHIWGVVGGMTQRTRRGLNRNGCAGFCHACEAPLRRKGVAAEAVPGSKLMASKIRCISCYQRELRQRKRAEKAKKLAQKKQANAPH